MIPGESRLVYVYKMIALYFPHHLKLALNLNAVIIKQLLKVMGAHVSRSFQATLMSHTTASNVVRLRAALFVN